MWPHLIAIVCVAVGCIIFGLLRAELDSDEKEETACGACDESSSCGHFCVRRPMTDILRVLGLKE